jgi:hypothetical protein
MEVAGNEDGFDFGVGKLGAAVGVHKRGEPARKAERLKG